MATLIFSVFLKFFLVSVSIVASCSAVQIPKVIEVNKAISRGSPTHGFGYAGFKKDAFSYLNITCLGDNLLDNTGECGLACLKNPSCFSFNVAAFPDVNEKLLCELLPSDKYNNSEKLVPSQGHHHFSIASKCSSWPCKNNGKCVSLYEESSYVCVCTEGFTGKNCETDMDECSTNSHNCSKNALCKNTQGSYNCTCNAGYFGDGRTCAAQGRDCLTLLNSGYTQSGVYSVNPDGKGSFNVYCDMRTDGGGWTVFQRRQDGSVNFFRGWNDYKSGFGQLTGEFWLGNDKIHKLTASNASSLRVELEDWNGAKVYAKYGQFNIGDEQAQYRLQVSSYSGTAGDTLAYHNNMAFTTKDTDNDQTSGNCAVDYTGAWWYKSCHESNLNGKYQPGINDYKGPAWNFFRSAVSLKFTEMKLR